MQNLIVVHFLSYRCKRIQIQWIYFPNHQLVGLHEELAHNKNIFFTRRRQFQPVRLKQTIGQLVAR